MKHPIEILEHYWGFSEFKPQQEAIIEAVLANDDCIALLPTGGGKSVCFQIPALTKRRHLYCRLATNCVNARPG